MERVVLPDCCEDWILAYGAFYADGAEFDCIECGSGWRKLEAGRFQSRRNGKVWAQRERDAEGQQFRYLESESSGDAITERCCAKLILDYGSRVRLDRQFTCPICGSTWKKGLIEHPSGLQVAGYANAALGVTLAVQAGESRSFLVPIDEYRVMSNE